MPVASLALALVLVTAAGSPAAYGDATVLLRFADPRISESSGLAVSSIDPGVVFTHNDSGDRARVFAVGPDGRTRTVFDVPGVAARDWEDMARGPDERGRSCLWLGDIGDNNGVRSGGVLVRRVLEPRLDGRREVRTEPSIDFRLGYPDGPGDAETLLVHPRTGRVYVVGKALVGSALVYRAPATLSRTGLNQLEQVAAFSPQLTGTPGGPGIGSLAQLLVTAGDISPDGSQVALRTYTDVYEWEVPGDDVAAAFSTGPVVSPLPPAQQGEGLAYSIDGRSLLVSSEGTHAPVERLVRLAQERAPSSVPSPSPPAPSPAAPAAASDPGEGSPLLPVALGLAAGGLLWLAVRAEARWRRSRR